MCVAIFGRIEIRPQKLSAQPLVVAKSGSRTRFDGWTCDPFLFMKLPINVRCQRFLFHPSICPNRGRARHIFTFRILLLYIFPLVFLIHLRLLDILLTKIQIAHLKKKYLSVQEINYYQLNFYRKYRLCVIIFVILIQVQIELQLLSNSNSDFHMDFC